MSESKNVAWSFVVLMAVLMSFVALSIDAMLPALGVIGADLNVTDPKKTQFVISSVFLGMGTGLIFFGPLSDAYGRKFGIYLGLVIFEVGCLFSLFSQTFEVMIFGRILQGLGGASCRVITVAMIRDRFEGNKMAKVMSLVMIFFIIIPAVAPSIGQLILFIGGWRDIFIMMLGLGLLSGVWLKMGTCETLRIEKRIPFSLKNIFSGIKETLCNSTSRGYMLAAGLIFGSFISYISLSQQILQVQYQLGEMFSLAFGGLALAIGCASFANSKWVEKYGMVRLCLGALKVLVYSAGLFLPYCLYYNGHPPFLVLMPYLALTLFCFGILFGNFNALAIQPLGHIAGVANSVISSLQTVLSVFLAILIGLSYDNSITPMIIGFFTLGGLSFFITKAVSQKAVS